MKRISLLVAAASLAVPAVPFVAASPAVAATSGSSKYCKDLRATDPGFATISQGRCVSYFNQVYNYSMRSGNTHALAVQYCKILEIYDKVYFDSLYLSQSDCVTQYEATL